MSGAVTDELPDESVQGWWDVGRLRGQAQLESVAGVDDVVDGEPADAGDALPVEQD